MNNNLTQLWYDKELPRLRENNFRGNEVAVSKFSFVNGYQECLDEFQALIQEGVNTTDAQGLYEMLTNKIKEARL